MGTEKEKKILKYEETQMIQALEAVRSGMSISGASKMYKVPRTTLIYKNSGKYPVLRQMGPSCVLGEESEARLVKWILESQKNGFPISRIQLIESVQKLVAELKLDTPFKDGKPGKKWIELFLQRHPDITQRIPESMTPSRGSVTEEKIVSWFEEVGKYLGDNNLKGVLSDPQRIFNADETAFFLSPKGGKVLAKRGIRYVHKTGNDEKECMTVMMTANAAGQILPPMIIFKYDRLPAYITNLIPDEWGVGKSDSGWMCGPTFFEFMANLFIPWLKEKEIQLPIIFFVDGHVSHLTLQVSQLCEENGVVLVCLPPNATHIIQPMDVAVFHPLKMAWKRAIDSFKQEMNVAVIRKEHFALVLKKALDSIDLKDSIVNGFRVCGLCPFTVQAIDMEKLTNSISEEKGNYKNKISEINHIPSHLRFIESILGKEKITCFRKCIEKGSEWKEPETDRSLFNFYKKVIDLAEDSEASHNTSCTTAVEINEKNDSSDENLGHSSKIILNENISPQNTEQSSSPNSSNLDGILPNNDASTPNKEQPSTSKFVDPNLPSPFKRLLVWPEEVTSKSKRSKRQHLPYVVTSRAYKEYYEKREKKKLEEEEAKKKRKEEREKRKQMKEKEKKLRKKKAKKLSSETETSDDELSLYSDDVDDYEEEMEEEDLSDTLLSEQKEEQNFHTQPLEKNEDRKKQTKYKGERMQTKDVEVKRGNYVIVKYEGEYFPGQVEEVKDQELYYVSAMKMSGYNWKWHEKGHEDIMWYSSEDVIQTINTPIKVNDRGTFRVPEMDVLRRISIL